MFYRASIVLGICFVLILQNAFAATLSRTLNMTTKTIHGQVQTKTETCTFEAMIPNTTDPLIELGEVLYHI